MKVLKDGGAVISLPSGDFSEVVKAEAAKRNIEVSFLLVESNGKDMGILHDMLAKGTLKPHVSKVFSFSEMREAHLALESGRTVGKIVVKVKN